MKKVGLFILTLFAVLFVGDMSQANDYEYKSLDINANILIDGTIDVNEDFTANFFKKRRGIIRNIPLNYSIDGQDFHINISNINVEGKKYETTNNNGNIEIKIGDVDKTIIGEQIYNISYSTYGLIKNFSGMGYSELYWNLVGFDYDININSVRAEIDLPRSVSFNSDDFLITVNGKENSVQNFGGTIDWSQGDKIIITYDKVLNKGEGITLAIKFPNDYYEFDHDKQKALLGNIDVKKIDKKKFSSNYRFLIYLVGFLAFFFGLMYVSKNWLNKKIKPVKVGRDFDSKYPVIVQYSPPKGMNSAEAGALFNCRVDPVDMTSLFYQWADKKLLDISYEMDPKNLKEIQYITFTKKGDMPDSYPFYERELFRNVFKDKKSRVIDHNTDLARILSLEGLEDYGVLRHWLFRRKNSLVRGIFYTLLYLLLLVLFFYCFRWIGIIFWLFLIPVFCGLAFKLDNKIRLTEEGGKLAAHIIGYAKFIKDCDENQLKAFLKQDPLFIDKTLPYAVAFGMETEFLKKVTPLLKDIEQTWLKQKTTPTFPVGDITNFMRNILTDKRILKGIISSDLSSLSSGGKRSSNWEFGKLFKNGRGYGKLKGFKVGSIFSKGGVLFKKGGGGGGGGSRSW